MRAADCVNEADVVFVLDSSGSIDEPYFDDMLEFASQVVDGFDVDDGRVRVGAVAFADDVQPAFNLSQYGTRQDVQVGQGCKCKYKINSQLTDKSKQKTESEAREATVTESD